MKKLWKKIRNKASKIYGEGTCYIVYLHSKDQVCIAEYNNIKAYSMNASIDGEIDVSFIKDRTMYRFTNKVNEVKEYRDSYEKYSGYIELYVPLTEDIANEINAKVLLKSK